MTQQLYIEKFCFYKGEDLRIMRLLQNLALRSLSTPQGDWSRDTEVIKRTYAKGVISEIYINYDFSRAYHPRSIPIDVARRITENAIDYPAFLVAVAEGKCKEEASKKVVPVAKVAEAGGWFQH